MTQTYIVGLQSCVAQLPFPAARADPKKIDSPLWPPTRPSILSLTSASRATLGLDSAEKLRRVPHDSRAAHIFRRPHGIDTPDEYQAEE